MCWTFFFRPNKKYIKLVSSLIKTFDNGKLKKEILKNTSLIIIKNLLCILELIVI